MLFRCSLILLGAALISCQGDGLLSIQLDSVPEEEKVVPSSPLDSAQNSEDGKVVPSSPLDSAQKSEDGKVVPSNPLDSAQKSEDGKVVPYNPLDSAQKSEDGKELPSNPLDSAQKSEDGIVVPYNPLDSAQKSEDGKVEPSSLKDSAEWTPEDFHWNIVNVPQDKQNKTPYFDNNLEKAVQKALYNKHKNKTKTHDKHEDKSKSVSIITDHDGNSKDDFKLPEITIPKHKNKTKTLDKISGEHEGTDNNKNSNATEKIRKVEIAKIDNKVNQHDDKPNSITIKTDNDGNSKDDFKLPEITISKPTINYLTVLPKNSSIKKSRNRYRDNGRFVLPDLDILPHDDSLLFTDEISEEHSRKPGQTIIEKVDKSVNNNQTETAPKQHKVPSISTVEHTKDKPETKVLIKSRKRGKVRVQIPVSHETLLNDQNMRNISVKVPLFKSTVLASGKHSFTFHMSHDSYDGIEKWVMVVVKLRKDKFGRPLFLKGNPADYKGRYKNHKESPLYDEPYITASFEVDQAPYKFTVGDGLEYGGSVNGRLESDESYGIFMAGVVYGYFGGTVYVESGWLVDAHAPEVPTYFRTNSESSYFLPICLLLATGSAAAGAALWYSWKRGMLIPFLDKLRAVRKQNSRFNTGYKFGKRSQNNFGKNADKQSKNPKVHNNEVEDNFYQYGNSNGPLPTINRPNKSSKRKQKTKGYEACVTGDEAWRENSSQMDAKNSQHDNLMRHFKSDHELEETVVGMKPSTNGSNW